MSECDRESEHLSNIFSHSLVILANVVIAGDCDSATRGGCFASLSGVNTAHWRHQSLKGPTLTSHGAQEIGNSHKNGK